MTNTEPECYAERIDRVEIGSLWEGYKHIVWELHPEVNVLSGRNGAGKSTILSRIIAHLDDNGQGDSEMQVKLTPEGCRHLRYDVIRSFDNRPIAAAEVNALRTSQTGTGGNWALVTDLDMHLFQLQRRYLDYQVDLSNRIIAHLSAGGNIDEAQRIAATKTHFQDLVDELFADTGKQVDRTCNELSLVQWGQTLSLHLLSSGEKQILIILLTALCQDCQPYAFFMDEPEASLHFEWQRRLIGLVRELNPKAQVIITTHSPAVIMDGWDDCVTEVEEITL